MLYKKFYLTVALAVLSVTVLGDHNIAKRSAGPPNWVAKCYQINNQNQFFNVVIISKSRILAIADFITGPPNTYFVHCGNQIYAVATITYHPDYVAGNHANNFCLLGLKEDMDFTANPTCGACQLAIPGYVPPTAPNACAVATSSGGLFFGPACAAKIPGFGTDNCCTSTGFTNGGSVLYEVKTNVVIGMQLKGTTGYSEFVNCYEPKVVKWCNDNK